MISLVLIPWAETAWKAAGRLAGRTSLPLTEGGRDEVRGWSAMLAEPKLSTVYASSEQAAVEVAEIVAEKTGASRKTVADLAEVDVGLWDGLTAEELKRRYPKIYKKWHSDPASVSPPEGEALTDAFARLRQALEKLMRKQDDRCVAVVLGPLAFALVRCWAESVELTELRSMTHDSPLRYELPVTGPGKGEVSVRDLCPRPEVQPATELDG